MSHSNYDDTAELYAQRASAWEALTNPVPGYEAQSAPRLG